MSRMIQALESRVLLSATSTSLAAELASVNLASNTMKADVKLLLKGATADLASLSKALKGSSKSNLTLLRKAASDERVLITKINADAVAMSKGTALAKTSVADGNATIKAPTNAAASAKIGPDTVALLSVAAKPSVKLTTDSSTVAVGSDLAAIAAANPTLPTVAGLTASAKTHLDALVTKVTSDATIYTNALSALRTDLTTLLPVPGVSPSLVGDYKGTFKTKAIAFGLGSQTVDFEIIITAQTINTVTGSITAAGNTASGTITASEYSNGKLTLKISTSELTVNLAGVVNVNTTKAGLPPGSVISGFGKVTVLGFDIDGTFIVTKVT